MIVPLSPIDFLERAETYFGHRPGVFSERDPVSYATFGADARRLASLLKAHGVVAGDRVAWLGPNSYPLLCAYYAAPLLGAILVPINTRLSVDDMTWIAKDCAPTVLLRDPAFGKLPGAHADVPLDETFETAWAAQPRADRVVVDENAAAEIFYTSGSTGRPKGVVWTHRSLYLHAVHSALTTGFRPDDVFLSTIPLFHVNGWGIAHYAAALGAQQVVRPFSPEGVLDAIDTFGVTRLFLVPTMAVALLESPMLNDISISSVRGISVGGAPVSPELLHRLERAFDAEVICGYGLTETSTFTRSHGLPGEDPDPDTKTSIGMPIIGAEVRVVAADGDEVRPDRNQVGEVIGRSNHISGHYWGQPDLAADVVVDGWFQTGDLATVDERGYLRIVDRKKDLIISGGENIASVEIEHVLLEHSAVVEAAVVGAPDERWGEVPIAFVTTSEAASPEELLQWCESLLARFKVPREVRVIDTMPLGGTGKIQKGELRRLL